MCVSGDSNCSKECCLMAHYGTMPSKVAYTTVQCVLLPENNLLIVLFSFTVGLSKILCAAVSRSG